MVRKIIPAFKLEPALKEYIWGGDILKRRYGKRSKLLSVAESWEVSAHPDGQSIIASGEYAGLSFGEFVHEYPQLCGNRYDSEKPFPILVKLIDAKEALSVQVHPNDDYAWRVEGENGKTEMWVILECEEDAFIYYGVSKKITREELAQRIQDNSLTEILNKRPVKPGDVIFIPAGTIHAIGKGIVLAEIQQNSNSTYRVFDYNRKDINGKPRQLHIQKAIDVAELTPPRECQQGTSEAIETTGYQYEQLVKSIWFSVSQLGLGGRFIYTMNGDSFSIFLCTQGIIMLQGETDAIYLRQGESAFIPSSNKGVIMQGTGRGLFISI